MSDPEATLTLPSGEVIIPSYPKLLGYLNRVKKNDIDEFERSHERFRKFMNEADDLYFNGLKRGVIAGPSRRA